MFAAGHLEEEIILPSGTENSLLTAYDVYSGEFSQLGVSQLGGKFAVLQHALGTPAPGVTRGLCLMSAARILQQ